MPWNLGPCCQIQLGIRGTYCCLMILETTLFYNIDTFRYHHFQLYPPGIQLRLLDPIGRILLALECIS